MTNNQKILNLIKQRLDKGAKKYGEQVPIHSKKRDNLKESIEEALDMIVYLSAFLIKIYETINEEQDGQS